MSVSTAVRYVRVAVAARQLRASEQNVRSLFDRGVLEGIRSEKGYRLIDTESLQRYQQQRYLTVSEAAIRLGISRDTVAKRFDTGELAGVRSPAGHRLIDPAGLPCA